MFRTLRLILFPPRIPPELARGYAEAHRSIIQRIQLAREAGNRLPPGTYPGDPDYTRVIALLSDHQRSIDDAMRGFRRGRQYLIWGEALRDLGLSKGMDQYHFGWGGPEYEKAVWDAIYRTGDFACRIHDL